MHYRFKKNKYNRYRNYCNVDEFFFLQDIIDYYVSLKNNIINTSIYILVFCIFNSKH